MPHDFRTCDCNQKLERLRELAYKLNLSELEHSEFKFLSRCLREDTVFAR